MKPHWRPYTHGIDGWGLRAESESYRVIVRLSLAGDWEWAITEVPRGSISSGSGYTSVIDALSDAEHAWGALHYGC